MMNPSTRKRFVLVGLLLVLMNGCDSPTSSSSTEPAASPSTRPLEGLEKDLKPPVIVGPNVPSPKNTEPN